MIHLCKVTALVAPQCLAPQILWMSVLFMQEAHFISGHGFFVPKLSKVPSAEDVPTDYTNLNECVKMGALVPNIQPTQGPLARYACSILAVLAALKDH